MIFALITILAAVSIIFGMKSNNHNIEEFFMGAGAVVGGLSLLIVIPGFFIARSDAYTVLSYYENAKAVCEAIPNVQAAMYERTLPEGVMFDAANMQQSTNYSEIIGECAEKRADYNENLRYLKMVDEDWVGDFLGWNFARPTRAIQEAEYLNETEGDFE